MERDNDSKGRVAVVTGANRGLGFAAVRELAGRGYRVILTARSQVKAAEAVKALAEEGLEVDP